jgi:hypothetical protein
MPGDDRKTGSRFVLIVIVTLIVTATAVGVPATPAPRWGLGISEGDRY